MKIQSRDTVWLLLLPLALWVSSNFGYAINHTPSHSAKYFLIYKTKNVKKGDLITFKSPETGIYRDTFTKKIMGVAGDVVSVRGQEILVNNIALGKIKSKSKTGAILHPIATQQITKGKYFVWSDNIDSFDSRYAEIGLIHESDIYGVAYPII